MVGNFYFKRKSFIQHSILRRKTWMWRYIWNVTFNVIHQLTCHYSSVQGLASWLEYIMIIYLFAKYQGFFWRLKFLSLPVHKCFFSFFRNKDNNPCYFQRWWRTVEKKMVANISCKVIHFVIFVLQKTQTYC